MHGKARALLALERMRAGELERGRAELAWTLDRCYFDAEDAADVLARLARWHLDRQAPADAIAVAQAAVDLDPEDGELHNLLGAAHLETGQLHDALGCFEAAERKGSRYGLTNKGVALWRLSRPTEALPALQQAVDKILRCPIKALDPIHRHLITRCLRALEDDDRR